MIAISYLAAEICHHTIVLEKYHDSYLVSRGRNMLPYIWTCFNIWPFKCINKRLCENFKASDLCFTASIRNYITASYVKLKYKTGNIKRECKTS